MKRFGFMEMTFESLLTANTVDFSILTLYNYIKRYVVSKYSSVVYSNERLKSNDRSLMYSEEQSFSVKVSEVCYPCR